MWQDILADKMPDVLMSADQQRERLAIQQYKATVDLVAPEIARAQKGGQPTQDESRRCSIRGNRPRSATLFSTTCAR
jgi:hypothetical protein